MTTLKLSFNDEVRRISLQKYDLVRYDHLQEHARTLFPHLLDYPDFQISWKDDEDDVIFISSDVELMEAVRTMRNGNRGYLRFHIHTDVVPHFQNAPRSNTEAQSTETQSTVHVGVTCSECGAAPIDGIRHKCTVRSDFNLCSTCEAKTLQPYPMIKFYTPHPDPTASDIVVSIHSSRHGHAHHGRGHGWREGWGGRGRSRAKDDGQAGGRRHRGVICDECNARAFRGARFKCTTRDDFDLCADCEAKTPCQPYPMVKVYSPDQCPNGLTVFTSSSTAPSPSVGEATIECDIQLPPGLEFLRDMFPPGTHLRGPWGSASWRERARQEGTPPPSGPARHVHVRCNECGMKPIVGARYHCTVRPDFDLCSACEAKQSQPHPMTKIYFPQNYTDAHSPPPPPPPHAHFGPMGWHGAVRGGRGGWGWGGRGGSPWHGHCGGRGRWGGGRGMARDCERGGWCGTSQQGQEEVLETEREQEHHHHDDERDNGDEVPDELQQLEEDLVTLTMCESLGSEELQCHAPLPSESLTLQNAAESSSVGLQPITLSPVHASEVGEGGGVSAAVVEVPVSVPVAPPKAKPMARFVRDVTMPDGSKVQPCSVFIKCWRVRNDGASAWPAQCRLVSAGGDDLLPEGSSELCCIVPSAAAGEELDISAQLKAPSAIGRHVGYFRLQDDEQNWFGQRLWADIRVTDDDLAWEVLSASAVGVHAEEERQGQEGHVELEQEVSDIAAPPPPTNDMIWARELELLASMGFTDSEVVIPLLQSIMSAPAAPGQLPHSEELQQVVLSLLSSD